MSFTLTPGYTFSAGETVTATKLNLLGVPTAADGQTYTFGVGAAATPSINFTGATTDGLYRTSSGVGIAIAGVSVSLFTAANGIQIKGTTTSDSASSGYVGEYATGGVSGTGVALTTLTIADVTSLSLTAGDWDVSATILPQNASPAAITSVSAWTNTTSISQPSNDDGRTAQFGASAAGGPNIISPVPMFRYSLSATTTIYLSVISTFTGSTSCAGRIRARRVR